MKNQRKVPLDRTYTKYMLLEWRKQAKMRKEMKEMCKDMQLMCGFCYISKKGGRHVKLQEQIKCNLDAFRFFKYTHCSYGDYIFILWLRDQCYFCGLINSTIFGKKIKLLVSQTLKIWLLLDVFVVMHLKLDCPYFTRLVRSSQCYQSQINCHSTS